MLYSLTQYDPNEMYLLACHPGGGYTMGGSDMQSLYLHGKVRHSILAAYLIWLASCS